MGTGRGRSKNLCPQAGSFWYSPSTQLRCLRGRFDCYRAERTNSRAGVTPAEVQRLSRRTVTPTIVLRRRLPPSLQCLALPLELRFQADDRAIHFALPHSREGRWRWATFLRMDRSDHVEYADEFIPIWGCTGD